MTALARHGAPRLDFKPDFSPRQSDHKDIQSLIVSIGRWIPAGTRAVSFAQSPAFRETETVTILREGPYAQ
ncbi:MAG: hypothetical protein ACREI2_10895 [Nitrospiraceae bacterium]